MHSPGPRDQAGTCTYSQENLTSVSTLLRFRAYHTEAHSVGAESDSTKNKVFKETDFSVNIRDGTSVQIPE